MPVYSNNNQINHFSGHPPIHRNVSAIDEIVSFTGQVETGAHNIGGFPDPSWKMLVMVGLIKLVVVTGLDPSGTDAVHLDMVGGEGGSQGMG